MCGGGSSGGSVTTVPKYISTRHKEWLDDIYADMNATALNNPYSTAAAYDPSVLTDGMLAALNAFCGAMAGFHDTSLDADKVADIYDAMYAYMTGLVPQTDYATYITAITSALDTVYEDATELAASVSEYSAQLQADIEATVIPKFEAGMRDANAVMTSSFVIGEALIYAEKDRNVAKYTADLKLAAHTARSDAISKTGIAMLDEKVKMAALYLPMAKSYSDFYVQGIDFKKQLTSMVLDSLRIIIIAKKEQQDEDLKIDRAKALWDIEMYKYAGSLLGAYQGTYSVQEGPSKTGMGTALGGAMSGAAAGAMVGSVVPGIGTAMGAIVGGVMGGAAGLFG